MLGPSGIQPNDLLNYALDSVCYGRGEFYGKEKAVFVVRRCDVGIYGVVDMELVIQGRIGGQQQQKGAFHVSFSKRTFLIFP